MQPVDEPLNAGIVEGVGVGCERSERRVDRGERGRRPLLGLLGTVTGMIQTFDVITVFGTSDPKLLSGGIATALVTTELGLIVAIPCLLAGSLLNGWAERIKDDMEKAALRAINLYHRSHSPGARAHPAPASHALPATADAV